MPTSGANVLTGVGSSTSLFVKSVKVGSTSANPGTGQIAVPETSSILFGVSGNKSLGGNANGTFFLQTNNATSGNALLTVYDSGGTGTFAAVSQGAGNVGVATTPLASAAPTGGALVLGTAWKNTNPWDVTLVVFLAITANTSLVVSLGVGPTNTPAQQTIITGTTALGVVAVPIRVPANYYALLSSTGVGTDALVGQIMYHN